MTHNDNGAPCGPSTDERRGLHLLSPGDIVRYRGDLWDVTGVHLAVERAHSTVTMVFPEDKFKNELRLPLSVVEGACEVYLRAKGDPAKAPPRPEADQAVRTKP